MARQDMAGGAVVVTPSDVTQLGFSTFGLWVGGAGALTVIMADGETVLISGVPAGSLLPIQVIQVKATGTTASLIVALKG